MNLNYNPLDPKWENRDRFILSGGHGSTLLYSLLHLFGYGLSKEELANVAMHGSGASAPAGLLFGKFGFTVRNVAETVKGIL